MQLAVNDGARQFAAELFQQACRQQELAVTHQSKFQYPLARLAYEQADKLFADARAKAISESFKRIFKSSVRK